MQHDVEKKFSELKKLVEEMGTDVEKYTSKKNKSAGLRIRKYMIDVKDLAVEIRKDILESRRNHL
ncbi:MAG: hypothetical protein K1X55_01745 [Chitinophagales bacterium]|nr:hypothetical protein [Chitinophagales bacterium]